MCSLYIYIHQEMSCGTQGTNNKLLENCIQGGKVPLLYKGVFNLKKH